jgi:uncharacterized lipoprotein NlpE involved in copper resistance
MKKSFFAKKGQTVCVVLVSLLLAVLCGCGSNKAGKAVDVAHSSRNSLNWAGVYTGVIPAASGPGIDVQLTLNEDGSYKISYRYIDRSDERFERTGTFTWNDSGSVVILDTAEIPPEAPAEIPPEFPPYYQVGENWLLQLDMEGTEITGPLAENYRLRKETN